MFNRLFGKPKQETNALTTLDKLNETLEMLEKKEKVLIKKASQEVEKAKEFTRAKNKRGMVIHLNFFLDRYLILVIRNGVVCS
ncbi:hypothetical protein EUGRSUZ_L03351 [Eucalyptus grandis]|uniref:Uncharacterized protein n=1 Tax=Eucalyptus grandis TaxID=71139 RepID=A0AAD9T8R4_EUCGR|nr:hypothetical protein EUGRSUZ_L03351 [Eucalyptus grandis]